MADPRPASFWTQTNALLRKNLVFQKRNIWANVRLIAIPFFLCLILSAIQIMVDSLFNNSSDGTSCGLQNSTSKQLSSCYTLQPPEWPPLLQIPAPEYRAVTTDSTAYADLPSESCRRTGSCPAVMLFTGENQSLGEIISQNMYGAPTAGNSSNFKTSFASHVLGASSSPGKDNYLEFGFISDLPIYDIQRECRSNSTFSISFQQSSMEIPKEIRCVRGLYLWRNSSSVVNDELYKGYQKGNPEGKINEFAAAFDFLKTDRNNLNAHIWYNASYKRDRDQGSMNILRVPRLVNLLSSAYLEFLRGPDTRMLFEFAKEMPKAETKINLDLASQIGPFFFTWVILLLFPVILTSLVYEKQQRLRIMMKMHGLGDGPYWIISYAYFLLISMLYMICFVTFGSAIGLNFFRLNAYSVQFVFYFVYINLQIAFAFLASAVFSKAKTATVVAFLCIFGTGLLGVFLFQFLLERTSLQRGWIVVMEIYPGFSLYRGLYEFSQSASSGFLQGVDGMNWGSLSSGMKEVLILMLVEWLLVLILAYYLDQIASSGKHPLCFLQNFSRKHRPSPHTPDLQRQDSRVLVEMEKPDVNQESEKVEQLLLESSKSYPIICDNLKKFYPGRDGNPPKFAVKGLSLGLPPGECFGMLGPNGAGKTSFINMMTGLMKPSSGTAFVHGLDILIDMGRIYTSMGICPQHDLLWETLTGREHLLFYGRLKNLKGPALTHAVEESLQSVNLLHGGVADKQAGKYSGGMKRRLSVAISLIGNPKVVYMDEPSTGLDPASRNSLWNVVKRAKRDCAIILTTHSMEEAEVLCDRLGIFVDGSLRCIGSPKELKARYGGSYVFTMTTSPQHEQEVEKLVRHISPNAKKIYHISGTQKFELPKQEVPIAEVFQAVEKAKSNFAVFAWGLTETTLEDVFIKVARTA